MNKINWLFLSRKTYAQSTDYKGRTYEQVINDDPFLLGEDLDGNLIDFFDTGDTVEVLIDTDQHLIDSH